MALCTPTIDHMIYKDTFPSWRWSTTILGSRRYDFDVCRLCFSDKYWTINLCMINNYSDD